MDERERMFHHFTAFAMELWAELAKVFPVIWKMTPYAFRTKGPCVEFTSDSGYRVFVAFDQQQHRIDMSVEIANSAFSVDGQFTVDASAVDFAAGAWRKDGSHFLGTMLEIRTAMHKAFMLHMGFGKQ